MDLETFYIFVLTKCTDKRIDMTKQIISWVKSNLHILKNGGVKIQIQPVTMEQIQTESVQNMLKDKYGVTGLPALFIPQFKNYPKETHIGIANIKKALTPVLDAGASAIRNEISEITEPESELERYMKSDLNLTAASKSGSDPDEAIGAGMDQKEIHKLASKFIRAKPGSKLDDSEIKNGLETRSTQLSGQQSVRRPDNIKASSSPVPSRHVDDDDSLLDNLMNNRIGLGMPDYN